MKKYVYPAVLTPEENGQYSVYFPDLEGCYTCGDDLADALFMAKDVLAFTLYEYEAEGRAIPDPANPAEIQMEPGEFINYVACDTLEYRKLNKNTAVKKTLSIPEWLNEEATEAGINFSQLLQKALKEELHIA